MNLLNKDPLIICICGKAKSGKSLVGNYIFKYYNDLSKKVIISPYSKYLKKYISEITNIEVTDENKPRDLLQQLSSELIKKKLNNPNFFINRQIEDIDFYAYFFDVIIIPDVRFPNEISILKEKYNRVVSIGVNRKGYENGLTESQKKDLTEISLDDYKNYDYLIKNTKKINLTASVLNILKDMEKRKI